MSDKDATENHDEVSEDSGDEEVETPPSAPGSGIYVTELGPHDVVMGRGTGKTTTLSKLCCVFYLTSFFIAVAKQDQA